MKEAMDLEAIVLERNTVEKRHYMGSSLKLEEWSISLDQLTQDLGELDVEHGTPRPPCHMRMLGL